MKIGLNMGDTASNSSNRGNGEITEGKILAAKNGDWTARDQIIRALNPLINNLAGKRTPEKEKLNELIEAGNRGVQIALKKYKPGSGADRFQIFALKFIETQMDRNDSSGFFSRLFGK